MQGLGIKAYLISASRIAILMALEGILESIIGEVRY